MEYKGYKYKTLESEEQQEVNRDVLEDYIHAQEELEELEKRTKTLKAFINRNKKRYEKYLWTNQLGQTVCILDIDNQYILNLTRYLAGNIRTSYDDDLRAKLDVLKAEIKRRKLETPAGKFLLPPAARGKHNPAIDLNDIPF